LFPIISPSGEPATPDSVVAVVDQVDCPDRRLQLVSQLLPQYQAIVAALLAARGVLAVRLRAHKTPYTQLAALMDVSAPRARQIVAAYLAQPSAEQPSGGNDADDGTAVLAVA